MMPLISVVIPAYNAEAFIESTLRSILAQDYENIEIILVNDASTDRTSEVAKRVLASDGCNGRVIDHEKNKGVSGARNAGIQAAKGQYIILIDADDLADTELLSSLYAVSSANDADIAFCGFRTNDEMTGAETQRPVPLESEKKWSADILTEMYIFGRIHPSICMMLFKSDFLRETGLLFTEGCKVGEDLEFSVKALSLSRRTAFSPNCLYTYRIHVNQVSETSQSTIEKSIEASAFVAEGQLRAARHVSENGGSKRIRNLARYYMMPKFQLKMLNILAWKNDKEGFMEALRAAETKNTLLSSRRMFFKAPELFFKALAALLFPDLYFMVRRKKIYGYGCKFERTTE